MREILITILILGCFSTFAYADRGLFEFHDSYGRCWRCLPGSACVRCSTIFVPFVSGPPIPWDRTCAKPTADICNANPGVKFPHPDIGFYWICADYGIIAEAKCFCDHVFDMRQQRCVVTHELTSIGCDAYTNPDPQDCATIGDTTTTTTTTTTTRAPGIPSVPTVPNESTKKPPIWIPTAPNEPTTTTGSTTTTKAIWVPTAPNETPTIQPPTTPPIWVPTAPNETPTIQPPTIPPIWVPTAPTETTTSNGVTDPNIIPTRTTEMGLPEGWTPPYFTVPPPTTIPPIWVPTAPTDPPPTGSTKPPIWVPTAPNEPTTNGITDPITIPTRTTEIGGPGVTNPGTTTTVTSDTGTTPAPCVCVVWWPCWCNPCWNMPCHSCNGCYGMMG